MKDPLISLKRKEKTRTGQRDIKEGRDYYVID
jgi:hypothetical protein